MAGEVNTDAARPPEPGRGGLEEELRRTRHALDEARRQAQRARDEMDEFAYIVSHDLQQPLRHVRSFAEMLKRRYAGTLDADADSFIGYVVDGATRAQSLVNDLLRLSRVSTRGNEFEEIACEELVKRVLKVFEVQLETTDGSVEVGPLPVVRADEEQLTVVFRQLIDNAIKFRTPGVPPRIEVAGEAQAGGWRFRVRDNGIGIEPRQFERVFKVFQRLHTPKEYPGDGVGLTLSRRIVERHGGRMWVESEPGKGSVFFFTIADGAGEEAGHA
jgi:light-regulated signal transduction histidine kinase (bacteriophytochrome)